ncbi:MAG: chorismate mutase [Treponema sp.]|nr:chorismate mutase [Treponema sp.]
MSISNRLFCIRGAICTDNNANDIIKNVELLFNTILKENHINNEKDFVSIQFTVTSEIDELNPAAALRKADIGIDVSHIPLFCSQEPVMKNSLKNVIRTMITIYKPEDSIIHSVYLNGAEILRPDLAKGYSK